MGQGKSILLMHRTGETVDGMISANPYGRLPYSDGQACDIDDFTVADDHRWDIGEGLLYETTVKAKALGATVVQVVVPDAEHPKRRMLEGMGFELGCQWLIRSAR